MKLLIGLVGEKGAGKGTFAKLLLGRCGGVLEVMRFSDILRATLTQWNLPVSRDNMQRLAQVMNEEFSTGTLARAMGARIAASTADMVLLDGVRWAEDGELVRSFEHNVMVYITTSLEVRFARQKNRGENVGEASMTFEQFVREEGALNEVLIPTIGATADVIIRNEGSPEDFERAVDSFYQNYIATI